MSLITEWNKVKNLLFSDITFEEWKELMFTKDQEFEKYYKKFKEDYNRSNSEMTEKEVDEIVTWGDKYNRTDFHCIAFFGFTIAAKLRLLGKDALAHYNQKDDLGFTPLDYAESQGHEKIVELIKEFENTRVKEEKK